MAVQTRRLWSALKTSASHLAHPWGICNDFNTILSPDERIGCHNARVALNDFGNFIIDDGVIDMGYTGNKFTWCRKVHGLHTKWARLDRFLINLDWRNRFPNRKFLHLARAES